MIDKYKGFVLKNFLLLIVFLPISLLAYRFRSLEEAESHRINQLNMIYSQYPLKLNSDSTLLVSGVIDSIVIVSDSTDTNGQLFWNQNELTCYFTPHTEIELPFADSPGIIVNFQPITVIAGFGYSQRTPRQGDQVFLTSDQFDYNPQKQTINIDIVSTSSYPIIRRISTENIPFINGQIKPLTQSLSSDVNINYWQYLYWLNQCDNLTEREDIVEKLILCPIFQQRDNGYERFVEMVDLNFPNLSRRKIRKLYRKHYYTQR